MNTNATYELNSQDLEEVNGGIVPVIITVFALGYMAGKASK